MPAFGDRKALVQFSLLSLATFSAFFTLSLSAVLAIVMKSHGLPWHEIGIVLSVSPAVTILFTLMGGGLAGRLGNLRSLQLGIGMLLVSNLSFHFTLTYAPAATLSRVIQGAAVGIFMAPAMAFARSKLTEDRLVYFFGIYSSMISLPYAFGPPAAEAYLNSFGSDWFFIVGAIPAAFGLLLSFALRGDHSYNRSSAASLSLLETAVLPGLRRPLIAVLVVGALYGLVTSYMAPILEEKKVPIGYFFTTFTVVVFTCRFVLIGFLKGLSHLYVLIFAVVAMATAYATLGATESAVAVTTAGVLFGMGFALAYPMLSIWVTEQFSDDQRTKPLAVFNTVFSVGIVVAPCLGSYVIAAHGGASVLYVLSGFAFALVPYLLMATLPTKGVATIVVSTTSDTGSR